MLDYRLLYGIKKICLHMYVIKLYHDYDGAGFKLIVEEIASFSQYELSPEMVCVVDAHISVFVWLGAQSCPRAKEDPRCVARAYLSQGMDSNYITLYSECSLLISTT